MEIFLSCCNDTAKHNDLALIAFRQFGCASPEIVTHPTATICAVTTTLCRSIRVATDTGWHLVNFFAIAANSQEKERHERLQFVGFDKTELVTATGRRDDDLFAPCKAAPDALGSFGHQKIATGPPGMQQFYACGMACIAALQLSL